MSTPQPCASRQFALLSGTPGTSVGWIYPVVSTKVMRGKATLGDPGSARNNEHHETSTAADQARAQLRVEGGVSTRHVVRDCSFPSTACQPALLPFCLQASHLRFSTPIIVSDTRLLVLDVSRVFLLRQLLVIARNTDEIPAVLSDKA